MEFNIETAGYFYPNKLDRDKLELIGFTFIPTGDAYKFKIHGEVIKNINSLDELNQFIKDYGTIIIDKDTITLYDNYIE